MKNLLNTFKETMRLGQILKHSLPTEIRDAEENGWDSDSIQNIRDGVEKYLRLVSLCARVNALLAFVPLIFVVTCVSLHLFVGIAATLYAVWAIVVGIAVIWLLFPLSAIVPPLRKLPDETYRELLSPVWANLEFCYLAITIGLLAFALPNWEIGATLPLWLLLGALWLFVPWIAYLVKQSRLFIALRTVQLILLIVWTFITVASPVPMTHFQSWAEREVANKIRPVEQREITSQWASQRWFTQEGKSNVWYSFSADRGYHLFAAPGHDPETNQELRPVSNAVTRDEIVDWFGKKKVLEENQLLVEKQKRDADAATLEKQRLAEASAQEERKRNETRTRLINDFVTPKAATPVEGPTVLVVVNGRQEEDSALTESVSQALNKAGLTNSIGTFTPAFIQSKLFRDVVAGATPSDPLFRADQYAGRFLVIQISVVSGGQQPVKSVDMLTSDLIAKVQLVVASNNRTEYSFEIKTRGTGFRDSDALKMAIDRFNDELIKAVPVLIEKTARAK